MMRPAMRHRPFLRWHNNFEHLHHAKVLMIENVTVKHEGSDVSLILGSHGDGVRRAEKVGGEEYCIFPLSL